MHQKIIQGLLIIELCGNVQYVKKLIMQTFLIGLQREADVHIVLDDCL